MKIIDRYLWAEMLGPFFIGIIGFILVLTVDLLFTMTDLIINKGVPFFAVLKLMAYKLPSLMVMTFPVSTLFGTAMALGRLAKDNEITALRTSGITLFRIARPILLVGLVVSLLSFITNEKIVPRANYVSNKLIREIIYKQPLPDVKENLFFRDQQNRYYYARRVDLKHKNMENVMIYEVVGSKYPRVIIAETANFNGRLWELNSGVVHKYDDQGYLNYEATFANMKLNISEDILSFSDQKNPQDMDRKELKELINVLGKGGGKTYDLMTELYLRFSIPLTCFVFALVGIPFSLPTPRSGRTWGVIMTIVFMFTFYVFASIFRSLGKGGVLPPTLAAFTPQISFIFIGMILLYREGRFR